MTQPQIRVLMDLLMEAKRKLWLAQTSGQNTAKSIRKYSERVEVLNQLIHCKGSV